MISFNGRPARLAFLRPIAKTAIATSTDRELFLALPQALVVMARFDPGWSPPVDENEVQTDWAKQTTPGFLAPSIVVTMDAIRKQVASW